LVEAFTLEACCVAFAIILVGNLFCLLSLPLLSGKPPVNPPPAPGICNQQGIMVHVINRNTKYLVNRPLACFAAPGLSTKYSVLCTISWLLSSYLQRSCVYPYVYGCWYGCAVRERAILYGVLNHGSRQYQANA